MLKWDQPVSPQSVTAIDQIDNDIRETDHRGELVATFVRQRHYAKVDGEPSFEDSIRVNVSSHKPCVMIAIWPHTEVGDLDKVEKILTQLGPRSVR